MHRVNEMTKEVSALRTELKAIKDDDVKKCSDYDATIQQMSTDLTASRSLAAEYIGNLILSDAQLITMETALKNLMANKLISDRVITLLETPIAVPRYLLLTGK